MADRDFCKKCFHEKKYHIFTADHQTAPCAMDCGCEDYEHGETRVTSATGAEKGTKEARYDLIPIPALDALARLYGKGAQKYAEHNWRLGYKWSLSYAAAQRHMNAFWSGEDIDPETQVPHVINAAFHMFALATFITEHPELDDRFETNHIPEQPALEDMLQQVFSVIPQADGDAEDLDILQKAGDDPIKTAAEWLAKQPEGKTVSFTDDFTDVEIAEVFKRAKDILDGTKSDD